MADRKDPGERTDLDAEKARQGTIILKHRWARFVFIAALVGIVIVAAAVTA